MAKRGSQAIIKKKRNSKETPSANYCAQNERKGGRVAISLSDASTGR